MTRRSKRIPLYYLAIPLVASAGCGKADWGYVSGVVTVDGRPVGPGTLVFEPSDEDRQNKPSALGYFDAEGRYEIVSAGHETGARTGAYRVVIMEGSPASLVDEGAAAVTTNTQIPARYTDYDAGLTAEIKTGAQVIDFPLVK